MAYSRPTPKLAGQGSLNVSQDNVTKTLGAKPSVPKGLRKSARKKAALAMMRGS